MLMNRPVASLLSPGPLVLAGLILLAALSRVLPHPPNFSPVAAVALFAGAYFAARKWAFIVPLAALALSDVVLASMHGGLYASWFGGTGIWLVAGSVLFFLVTNFGAWIGSPMYPQTAGGLAAAYIAGVPFFQWTVLSTLFYSALLFGGFALLRRQVPALRAQTA